MLRRVIFLAVLFGLLGCGAVLSALPRIVPALIDAISIVDQIDKFVEDHFAASPDEGARTELAEAVRRVRADVGTVSRLVYDEAAKEDGRLDVALADFRRDYSELLRLAAPLGIRTSGRGGAFSASARGLTVPEPILLKVER